MVVLGNFDVERFIAAHLNFSGRGFDIVLFWDMETNSRRSCSARSWSKFTV